MAAIHLELIRKLASEQIATMQAGKGADKSASVRDVWGVPVRREVQFGPPVELQGLWRGQDERFNWVGPGHAQGSPGVT